MAEIIENRSQKRNPRTRKIARIISLISVIGWIVFYVSIVILLFFEEDGHLAHQFVHPIGAGYITSGLIGNYLMKREKREILGAIIIFWGYIATTCAMVLLMFPLFIPDSTGFEWYVYFLLIFFFMGVVGSSALIR